MPMSVLVASPQRFVSALLAVACFAVPTPVLADLDADLDAWLAPFLEGTVKLDVRGRYEYADIAGGLKPSNAVTLRTRLGYGTKPWEGLSGYAEFENIATPDSDGYFDGIAPSNGKSIVADPTVTEVNQVYALIERQDFGNSMAKLGRQRITFDDHRFIGNVGWRQNEQTYDAVLAGTALGVEGLALQYSYLHDVHRIYGNQGTSATRDWDSNSHLARAAYRVAPWLEVVGFAYFLDLRDAPANSANSFGGRATGAIALSDAWTLAYQGSYAHQVDGGTSGGDNPTDYSADYVLADAALTWAPFGTLGGGYELLGSDGGRAVFTTPLATGHKFNGWADAFLDNGGPNGLQDAYVYLAPKLPWKLDGRLVYHHFWSSHGSRDYGNEYDAVLSRKIGKYVTVLTKVAWYDARGASSTAPADRVRYWLEATFAF